MAQWFLKLLPEEKQGVLGFIYSCLTILYYLFICERYGIPKTITILSFMIIIPITCLLLCIAILKYKNQRIQLRKLLILNYFSNNTIGLFLFSEYAFISFFWYLYLIIGSGVRYGNTYMFVVVGMCFCGLTSLYMFNDYWSQSIYIYIGLVLTIVIIPIYVSVLNRRLNELLVQANAANEEKDRFIATMSHELRTPLTGVITASQLIDHKTLSAQNSNLIGTIKNSSNELLMLINQILDFSKTEATTLNQEAVHFFPYALVKECISILQPEADKKDIKLFVQLKNNFHLAIIGNEQKIRQVLINIISNAVKFTDDGHVYIELEVNTDHENSSHLEFLIVDTGVGMYEIDQKTVFEPFKQADEGITRKHEGTGLGTTISKQLVEELSGELSLTSEKDVGTRVRISIPVEISDQTLPTTSNNQSISLTGFDNIPVGLLRAAEQTPATLVDSHTNDIDVLIKPSLEDNSVSIINQSKNNPDTIILANPNAERITHALELLNYSNNSNYTDTTEPEIPNTLLGKQILIVDDNLTNRTIIEMVLNELGTETTTASDGPEALELIQEQKYDLFIFDRHMPKMSGNDLLANARKIYKTDNLKAILLTADISEDAIKEAKLSGFLSCVHKPFEPEELTKLVIDSLK